MYLRYVIYQFPDISALLVYPVNVTYRKLLYLADCGPPPMVERAVLKEYTRFIEGVRLPGTLEGVTRVYECQANTVAEGMTSTVCQIDGQWSTTNLYCRRKF